jgi:hypothetical protein
VRDSPFFKRSVQEAGAAFSGVSAALGVLSFLKKSNMNLRLNELLLF